MKLRKALLDSSMHTTRLLLALSSLTWAFLLLLPGSLFQGRPTYAVMSAIASEEIWGDSVRCARNYCYLYANKW